MKMCVLDHSVLRLVAEIVQFLAVSVNSMGWFCML